MNRLRVFITPIILFLLCVFIVVAVVRSGVYAVRSTDDIYGWIINPSQASAFPQISPCLKGSEKYSGTVFHVWQYRNLGVECEK